MDFAGVEEEVDENGAGSIYKSCGEQYITWA
jgi:hypothetical protein